MRVIARRKRKSPGTILPTQAYLHTHIYHAAVDALERITRDHDPANPDCLRSTIIEALGEIGGIWPASCYTGEDERAGPSVFVTA